MRTTGTRRTVCPRLLAAAEREAADLVADNQYLYDDGADRVVRTAFPQATATGRWTSGGSSPAAIPYADFDFGMLKPMVRTDFIRRHRPGLSRDREAVRRLPLPGGVPRRRRTRLPGSGTLLLLAPGVRFDFPPLDRNRRWKLALQLPLRCRGECRLCCAACARRMSAELSRRAAAAACARSCGCTCCRRSAACVPAVRRPCGLRAKCWRIRRSGRSVAQRCVRRIDGAICPTATFSVPERHAAITAW